MKGNKLFVIVNSDHQRSLKGAREFQKKDERVFNVTNIKSVDMFFLFIDQNRTLCATIKQVFEQLSSDYDIVFANGSDRNYNSIPEVPICYLGIELIE